MNGEEVELTEMYLLEDRKRPNRFLRYFSLRDWHANNLTIEHSCACTLAPLLCVCARMRTCMCGQAHKWKDHERTLGVLAFPLVLPRVLVYLCSVF